MYLKRHEHCVLFLEDGFGVTKWPERLRNAGFEVVCFRDDFKDHEGKPERNVKDPRIINHCHRHSYVLITTDKNLCYRHIETVKKTEILVIATESNNSEIGIWVEALIKGKARIERSLIGQSGHAVRVSVETEKLR